jgi:nucleoid-associated protein YgaU
LIIPVIALVIFLRSDPRRHPPESITPETVRGERLLLRKTASATDEATAAESTSLPSRLAAERRSADVVPSDADEPNSAPQTQPLPGTHLDPAAPTFAPTRPSGSSASDLTTVPTAATARERPSNAATTRTATGRHFVKHRVVDGDDLRRLARRYLNDANRAIEIFHLNRDVLVQPDLLPLGVELQIPSSRP